MTRSVLHLQLMAMAMVVASTAAAAPKAKPPPPKKAAAPAAPLMPSEAAPPALVSPSPAPPLETVPPPAPVVVVAPQPPPVVAPLAQVVSAPLRSPVATPAVTARHRLGLALRVGTLVPAGRTAEVSVTTTAAAAETLAGRAATFAGSLQLSWSPPVLDHAFSVGLEAGFYPLSGAGSLAMPNDPDFGTLTYDWSMRAVPVVLGLSYTLPLRRLPWWPHRLQFAVEAGFVANHTRVTTTYTSGAEPVEASPQSGWALGFLAGLEGALRVGPGDVVLNVRYLDARTDLGLPAAYPTQPWNARLGDVQGTNVLAGYRLNLSL
jgi:hypothetical protein